jgi:xylulokinase
MWFQMAAMLNGARPMQWFADSIGAALPDLLVEAATVAPGDAPLFLPYLTGERSPHGDPHIRGAFYGLSDGMSRAEMMRGVINAIAFSFADAADSLRGAGSDPADILAIGGGAQSDLLLQTIADVLNVQIKRSDDPATGPALGAAKLAAVTAGAATADDLAARPAVQRIFEPVPCDLLTTSLGGYRALYHRLKGIHEDMQRDGA